MIAPTLSAGQYNMNQTSPIISVHQIMPPYVTTPLYPPNNTSPIMHQPPVQIALGLSNSSPGMMPSNQSWVPPGSIAVMGAPSWDSRHIPHPHVYNSYEYQQNNPYPPAPNMPHPYPLGTIPATIPIHLAPGLPDNLSTQNPPPPNNSQPKSYNKEFPPLAWSGLGSWRKEEEEEEEEQKQEVNLRLGTQDTRDIIVASIFSSILLFYHFSQFKWE